MPSSQMGSIQTYSCGLHGSSVGGSGKSCPVCDPPANLAPLTADELHTIYYWLHEERMRRQYDRGTSDATRREIEGIEERVHGLLLAERRRLSR